LPEYSKKWRFGFSDEASQAPSSTQSTETAELQKPKKRPKMVCSFCRARGSYKQKSVVSPLYLQLALACRAKRAKLQKLQTAETQETPEICL
jgi:hypothetical protein